MEVYAAAAGEVVFAGSEYPGLVVIVQHPDGLFSMYGHLDYALAVEAGQSVARGQLLGTVLTRTRRSGPESPPFRAAHLLHHGGGQRKRAPLWRRLRRRLPARSRLLAD